MPSTNITAAEWERLLDLVTADNFLAAVAPTLHEKLSALPKVETIEEIKALSTAIDGKVHAVLVEAFDGHISVCLLTFICLY